MLTFLDPAEEAIFARQGYVVRPVLDAHQIDAARRALEDWAHNQYGAGLNGIPTQLSSGHFFSDMESDQTIRDDLTNRLFPIVDAAFRKGARGAPPNETGVAVKKANAATLEFHQHTPMLMNPFSRHVLSWCSLEDCDETSGCMFVVPRSHSLYRQINIGGERPFFSDYIDVIIEKYAVPVPVKAGEAVYFDNLLLHGSYPNQRSVPRLAILTSFVRDSADKVGYRRADDGGIEVVGDHRENHLYFRPEGMRNGRVLKRLPAWNRRATLEEFEALLECDLHPSEDFDPLEFLFGPEAPHKASPPPISKRGPMARLAAKLLPGAIKPPLRRLMNGLGRGHSDHGSADNL